MRSLRAAPTASAAIPMAISGAPPRDGVHCLAPDGHLMGKILVPEMVSNICFGGRAKHRLFITATTGLYSVVLNRIGAQAP